MPTRTQPGAVRTAEARARGDGVSIPLCSCFDLIRLVLCVRSVGETGNRLKPLASPPSEWQRATPYSEPLRSSMKRPGVRSYDFLLLLAGKR